MGNALTGMTNGATIGTGAAVPFYKNNVDLSSVRSSGTHLKLISQEMHDVIT